MLKLITEDYIKVEYISKVTPLYQELVEKTKQEPQCIAYDLFIDQTDPGHFIFIEEWPDEAALNTHIESEHFKRLVPQINQFIREENTFLRMKPFLSDS